MGGGGAAALLLARRFRWLDSGGQVAALLVGACIWVGAGWLGLAQLAVFFVSSSALTRVRGGSSPRGDVGEAVGATQGAEAEGDASGRTARQVLANGGVAAAVALVGLVSPTPAIRFAVAGALAAATADTWSTEVGTSVRATTRTLTRGAKVEPGRSGGVSWPGTAAGVIGAAVIGLIGLLSGTSAPPAGWVAACAIAGTAGMLVDSALGAEVEGRLAGVDNDTVNLVGTGAGAAVAWLLVSAAYT